MQGKLVLWILFRNRKLHTLNDRGELLSFESFGIGNTSKVTVIASILELNRGQDLHGSIPYLVECFDGRPNHSCSIFWFSLCRWLWIRCYSPPSCFRVFKLASINSRWDEVKNIGIHIVFGFQFIILNIIPSLSPIRRKSHLFCGLQFKYFQQVL